MMSPPRVKVVVIGAGQAGLSVAYYLRRFELVADQDFVMLDRAPGPGGAWQHRWSSLRLGTAHRVNDLPGMAELGLSFDTADRTLPAKEVVADYYGRFEEHFDLKVMRPMNVRRVSNEGVDVLVDFEDLTPQPLEEQKAKGLFGRRRKTFEEPASQPRYQLQTQFLVNATGTWGSPFVPYYPGMAEFAGRHVHTSDYTESEDFRDKHVVVVGGGTSAIGFMLELEDVAAGLTWVSRRPIDWLDRQELDLEGASAAVALQDEAARSGRALPSIVSGTGVPKSRRMAAGIERGLLVARPMFDRIEPDRVVWDGEDGGMVRADVIIWATGFRPDLRHLSPLKLREKTGGITVGQGAAWSDPRIFLAGYGPQASTIGANRAGRMIARQIMAMI
ncbi:MAG TPA: FAD-dependent oxidoreductase [Agromyces sp.]|nr:FAD-dependent oxidoreductase [Agromyces sp.]